MINVEIFNQMSRKLNENKDNLDFQIQSAISSAITEKILPSIQNTLEMQGRAKFTMVDQASDGLHPGPRTSNSTMED